ncbi:hypothetical protein HYV31_01405 [candidate division WWE3 bacterium]|nr:hypothetical protein [candidate division WWE3 bacterium]
METNWISLTIFLVAVVTMLIFAGYNSLVAHKNLHRDLADRYQRMGIDAVRRHPAVKQVMGGCGEVDWSVTSYFPKNWRWVHFGVVLEQEKTKQMIATHNYADVSMSHSAKDIVTREFGGSSACHKKYNFVLVEIETSIRFPWQLNYLVLEAGLI